jgi:hypothetical protein
MKTSKILVLLMAFAVLLPIQAAANTISWPLVKSAGSTCSRINPSGFLIDHSFGDFENLEVLVQGLPPNTDFDLFSIQVPNGPFGLAWYIGDIQTDASGVGVGNFVGRFSRETFIVATGTPQPNLQVFPGDASTNPVTPPVHTYHLGLWFNSPTDAVNKGGCAGTQTPFNGEHNAGVQILNTGISGFTGAKGPLFFVQ